MPSAYARTLKVRPVQSSDVAFNMAGVIDFQDTERAILGGRVEAFVLQNLYMNLGQAETDGRLHFDAQTIRKYLDTDNPVLLFSLRSESLSAALEKAINQRQIAYYQTYAHISDITGLYSSLYRQPSDSNFPTSKIGRLESLAVQTDQRYQVLKTAYTRDGVLNEVVDVVTKLQGQVKSSTTTMTNSASTSNASSKTSGRSDTSSSGTETSLSDQTNSSSTAVKTRPLGANNSGSTQSYIQTPQAYDKLSDSFVDIKMQDASFDEQKMIMGGEAHSRTDGKSSSQSTATSESDGTTQSQSSGTSKTDGDSTSDSNSQSSQRLTEYRYPLGENELRWHRRNLDLQDELLSHELFALRVPFMQALMENELKAIDLDIKQLQLNYIHTIIVPPVSGIITAIYKDVGESVAAGEPILRIENDEDIFVVGRVNFRGRLELNSAAKFTIKNAFQSGSDVALNGKLVAIRGNDADNDEWDLIFRCDNRDPTDARKRLLPINYTFDHEEVKIDIT